MQRRLIFLTHHFDDIDRIFHKCFSEVMLSVEPLYSRRLVSYLNFRRDLASQRVAYDSGGFAFLIGRIKEPPDPKRTCAIYKTLGYTDRDFLIQLDVPPLYHASREERLRAIQLSAKYYWVMAEELRSPNLLPVVHGWDREELELSLALVQDPDRLALGGNLSTSKVYAHDYIQKVALGSYRVSSIVATPTCMAEMKGVSPAGYLALGSYANTKNSVAWGGGSSPRVPVNVVFDRLCVATNMLRDRQLFVLGGSGPNTAHLLFLLGAKFIDGAAWRLAAKLWRIYVPGLGEYSVGRKRLAKRLDDEALRAIRELLPRSPFSHMSLDDFLRAVSSESRNFEVRALWNAWALKVEEGIANEYACDPDRYYRYLRRRWERSPYWCKILDFCWGRIKKPYVQQELTIYLKADFSPQ